MINRPSFHMILTFSVLVILIGIVLVIFTQFDRGSFSLDDQPKDYSKQQELIRQIVEKKSLQNTTQIDTQKNPTPTQSVLKLIEQVKKDDKDTKFIAGEKPQTETDHEIARINQLNQQPYSAAQPARPYPYSGYGYYDYSQDYWLNNNPWSPYYDPNRR